MIRFNKPFIFGEESQFVNEAIQSGKLSGNGYFTERCQEYFKNRYDFTNCFLTHSCSDALEMIGILLEVGEGDEVIVPSYTFGSSANAFALRGADVVFADSCSDHPNISVESIAKCITTRTKVIVVVHYAGVSCDMSAIMELCRVHNIQLVEDAAQSVNSFYNGKPIGSFGVCSAFSFHETKNVVCGEGGLLVVNDQELVSRAQVIWENGTNKALFKSGKIDRYSHVDIGSSYYPSELDAAFLFGQLQHLEDIQSTRLRLWDRYHSKLKSLSGKGNLQLPIVPDIASNNGHMYYLVCESLSQRDGLMEYLLKKEVQAVFHYSSLHKSEAYKSASQHKELENSDRFSDCLVRLPLHLHLKPEDVDFICDCIIDYLAD